MKATGIVRKVDDLGRICLPKSMLKTISTNNFGAVHLEIFSDEDGIFLRPYWTRCVLCEESDQKKLTKFKGKCVCDKCREGMGKSI